MKKSSVLFAAIVSLALVGGCSTSAPTGTVAQMCETLPNLSVSKLDKLTDPTKKYVVPGEPENSLLLTILRGPVDGYHDALVAASRSSGETADIVAR